MFYSLAFPFRVILELFDMNDGLRKLYNVVSGYNVSVQCALCLLPVIVTRDA